MPRADKVIIEQRSAAVLNPLIRKLENFTVLSDEAGTRWRMQPIRSGATAFARTLFARAIARKP
jgi:hypothetical protein